MSTGQDLPPPLPPTDGQDTEQEILGGFPRHLTQQLIREEGKDRGAKTAIAGWLIGAGLAALALALPQEQLIGRGPSLIATWSQGVTAGSGFVYHGLLLLTSAVSGLRLEPAAFLLSALLYGACFPVLFGFGRRLGLAASIAIPVTLIVLTSPAAWLAATLPGPEALGLLAVILLMRLLWSAHERGASGTRAGLALVMWAIGCDALPSLVWCVPVVVLVLFPPKAGASGWRSTLPFALAFLAAALAWTQRAVLNEHVLSHADEHLDSPEWLVLIAGLGFAWVGLFALPFQRRNESEERPPVWLAAWAALPLIGIAFEGLGQEISAYHLLPLAALGGFDALARRADDLLGWEPVALVLSSAALLLGLLAALGANDHLADWRAHTRQVLEPDDLVLTSNHEHAYLLRERWGLEVLVLQDVDADDRGVQMADARLERRRIVLGEYNAPLPEDLLALPRLSELSSTE